MGGPAAADEGRLGFDPIDMHGADSLIWPIWPFAVSETSTANLFPDPR